MLNQPSSYAVCLVRCVYVWLQVFDFFMGAGDTGS